MCQLTFVPFVALRAFCFRNLKLEERKKNHRTDMDYTDITCKKTGLGGGSKKVQQNQRGLYLILLKILCFPVFVATISHVFQPIYAD